MALELLIALALILINGWFVLAEFAIVRVRPTQLRELASEGRSGAKRALAIMESLNKYLAACQLGITLASLALGWIGEPALARLLEPVIGNGAVRHAIAVALAFIIITYLHVLVGEQLPKIAAIQRAEDMTLMVARPLHAFYILAWPLITLLQGSANAAGRLFGVATKSDVQAPSHEELRLIVAASHRQGELDESTRELLDSVLDYNVRIAREVMTPRRDVVALEVTAPIQDSLQIAIDKEYTRYPLIDSSDDRVLGFVHIKDLTAVATGRRKIVTLADVVREPVYVPETVTIDRVRRRLQARRTHFGIVVDEFGEFTGVVTLEDVLEQLVGQIQDELDVELPRIVRKPDGSLEVDAALLLDTARRKLGLAIDEEVEGIDTLGGYVFAMLGRAPARGDVVTVGDRDVEVLATDELRILRLRITATRARDEAPRPPAT